MVFVSTLASAQEPIPTPAKALRSTMTIKPLPSVTSSAPTSALPLVTSRVHQGTTLHETAPHGNVAFGTASPGMLFSPGTLDRLHHPLLRQDLIVNGAASCATSNCHAGPRPGVTQATVRRGAEYQLWLENDPHAQSWKTICSDESVAMMRRLKIMDGDQIVDQAGFDNCMACHNSTRRYNEPRHAHTPHANVSDVNSFQREGVGCSACHGPSQRWIGTHFQHAWSPQFASDEGFVDTSDLYVRARMCASCHVGDKDRDMNHDIIAAGHPALRYELATFHAWQPKHWRDAEANDRTYYEAQLWLAGQIAATDASLALLETRAAKSHTISQWPEFASYDCASCHHNLGLQNARTPITDDRKAVALYSSWNDAGLRWLIHYRIDTGVATTDDFELLESLDRVKLQMESQPKADPGFVAELALQARRSLARWFDGPAGQSERAQFRSDRLGNLVAAAAGKRQTWHTWESAAQFYLAAVAARESWPGGWHGPVSNLAHPLRVGLRYPEMIDVSRYSKRNESGPTLNRSEATKLGIELAGWLGPVYPSQASDEILDDEAETQSLQNELDEMIQRINQRWKRLNEQRIEQAKPAESADKKSEDGKPDQPAKPERKPKTRQELLEELRQMQEARESDESDN
ncbi:multiheme c-type cytochrome [Novipirellula caenicola]|uniref:Cytochrome c-552/4 domain-containing protein n=1 Tax=Novipirellula caenicola TaxID=1536901 RepID=A0ABP9W165_9BACT